MIVVTTPTGDIGHQVVDRLLERDVPVRVVVRDPARLSAEVQARVEIVQGSHGDLDVATKAFAGADAVLWIVPPDYQAAAIGDLWVGFTARVAEAFRQVTRVVGVSALGRGTGVEDRAGYVTESLAMDDLIASTGVYYRALAMPSFMDNLLGQAEGIGSQGVLRGPLEPDLALPTCATRDIAAAAVELLLDDSWTGNGSIPVLGPEDLSGTAMAEILSEVLDRPVSYQQTPFEVFRGVMVGNGMSEAMAEGMLEMMQAKNSGLDQGVVRTPQNGGATSFRQWCTEVLKPAVK